MLDADIRAYYDTIDREHLRRFIEHRIGDRCMVRLLMKWVKAGVLEEGKLRETQEGVPQGATISPLLSNLYLHYVFDPWICHWGKKCAKGEVYVVRYADDLVVGLQKEQDARELHQAIAERLSRFGLERHPEKPGVIDFGRFARRDRESRGLPKPDTFECLGFVHICGMSREGKFKLRRRTSRKKRRAKMAQPRRRLADAGTGVWWNNMPG